MDHQVYKYVFNDDVPREDIESSMVLAILATESLHGEAQTRLDAAHYLDKESRACVVDARTAVGKDLARLFTQFIGREFGADAFTVQRVDSMAVALPTDSPASGTSSA